MERQLPLVASGVDEPAVGVAVDQHGGRRDLNGIRGESPAVGEALPEHQPEGGGRPRYDEVTAGLAPIHDPDGGKAVRCRRSTAPNGAQYEAVDVDSRRPSGGYLEMVLTSVELKCRATGLDGDRRPLQGIVGRSGYPHRYRFTVQEDQVVTTRDREEPVDRGHRESFNVNQANREFDGKPRIPVHGHLLLDHLYANRELRDLDIGKVDLQSPLPIGWWGEWFEVVGPECRLVPADSDDRRNRVVPVIPEAQRERADSLRFQEGEGDLLSVLSSEGRLPGRIVVSVDGGGGARAHGSSKR